MCKIYNVFTNLVSHRVSVKWLILCQCVHSVYSLLNNLYLTCTLYFGVHSLFINLYTTEFLFSGPVVVECVPEMISDSHKSLNHRDPFWFSNLDKSLDIKIAILKVSIPVLISRLKIWESWFQSQYQEPRSESLDSSLDIKTKVSKVLNPVLISRFWSWNLWSTEM